MKSLLLHACCAPCSLEPVRLLREEGFEPTICWTNPNIQPRDEWRRRLDELRRWCADGDIELIEAGEDRERWEAGVAPLGADRPRRCRSCYALRLAEACRVAQERRFEYVGTTLAVSPYQLFDTCNDVLERLAAAHGLTPVIRDFSPVLSRGYAPFARTGHVSTELLRLPLFCCRGGHGPRPHPRRAQSRQKVVRLGRQPARM